MKNKRLAGLVTGIFVLAVASIVNATPYGYDLTISGNNNVPTFTLENIGQINITGYSLTIGNIAYNWDAIYQEVDNDNVGYSLVSGDAVDSGALRVDMFEYAFTSFSAGNIFIHEADVDKDDYNTLENYKTILFNNGDSDNALLTVSFLGADALSMTLPDYTGVLDVFEFSQSVDTNPIPEPATMLLFGTGLAVLVGSRIRKKKK